LTPITSKGKFINNIANKPKQWLSTWGSVCAWCLFLFILSAQPDLGIPGNIPESDKVVHLLVYGVLGWLWGRAVKGSWPGASALITLLSVVAFSGLYGSSDEWHQSYVPGRSADLLDAIVDVCGGTLGGAAFLWWGQFRESGGARVSHGVPEQLRDPYDPAA